MKFNWLFNWFIKIFFNKNRRYRHDLRDDRLPWEEFQEFEKDKFRAIKEFEDRNRKTVLEFNKTVLEFNDAKASGYIKTCSAENIQLASQFFNIGIDDFLNQVFIFLDKIQLAKNYTMSIKTIRGGTFNTKKLYVTDNFQEHEFNIQKYLRVDDTIDSVWQAFLIQCFIDIHNNIGLNFVFSKDDINSIKPFGSRALPQLSNFDITPYIGKYGNKYFISYCLFLQWGGLVRRNIEITLFNNRISTYKLFQGISLYGYDCGIMI